MRSRICASTLLVAFGFGCRESVAPEVGRTTIELDGCGANATRPIYFVVGGNDGRVAQIAKRPRAGSLQGLMVVGYIAGRESIVSSPFRVSLPVP